MMRSVTRTLAVLRVLSKSNGLTVLQLSRELGISRTAIYRILEAMIAEGYVVQHAASDTYRLTIMIRQLSDGFRNEDWASEVASPAIEKLQREIVWPTDFFTYDDDAMVLRESSRRGSPMVIDRVTIGERLPVLLCAVGIAYLAACSKRDREAILARLSRSEKKENSLARDRQFIELILAETRKREYAMRPVPFMPHTGSIAVPIIANRRPLGAISFTYIASALKPQEAAAKHLKALRRAADAIELNMEKINSA